MTAFASTSTASWSSTTGKTSPAPSTTTSPTSAPATTPSPWSTTTMVGTPSPSSAGTPPGRRALRGTAVDRYRMRAARLIWYAVLSGAQLGRDGGEPLEGDAGQQRQSDVQSRGPAPTVG